MALKRTEVTDLLYGDGLMRRFTQDSPVLPDVWVAYAENPGDRIDLLLTPYQDAKSETRTPGEVRDALRAGLGIPKDIERSDGTWTNSGDQHEIAYNQNTVAVRLTFDEMVRVVLPISKWWSERILGKEKRNPFKALREPSMRRQAARVLSGAFARSESGRADAKRSAGRDLKMPAEALWLARAVGAISLAARKKAGARERIWPPPKGSRTRDAYFAKVIDTAARVLCDIEPSKDKRHLVHLVSRNRTAKMVIQRSIAAVKADATARVFNTCCKDITWAIIDTGIDAKHPAFQKRSTEEDAGGAARGEAGGAGPDWRKSTRVVGTYDFTVIRKALRTDGDAELELRRARRPLKSTAYQRKALKESLNTGREIDWSLVEPLLRVPHDDEYPVPGNEHGTHVAGILAADWQPDGDECPISEPVKGMCPDMSLYDMRVLNDEGYGDEFSIMAALQFVRHLNSHSTYTIVHGVNLSLSIPHEAANYACGRTPVCDECTRLVGRGIVVVAAAGNEGHEPPGAGGDFGGYQGISITDPGNAEAVITVGATHRDSPHAYGVSYFSSRGPTGDGRAKPDLVAPGEKIESCVPGGGMKAMDGTSMAAPHVSGAAALLMARHAELIGDPARIKQILCESATDLGRERYFQGHGMLDVLRALQSV
jgi:hypothetical protein